MTGKFVTQAAYARARKVSRKTATTWKQRGLLVIRAADGLVNVAASDKRLAGHGVTLQPVTSTPQQAEGNSQVTDQGNSATTDVSMMAIPLAGEVSPVTKAFLDQIVEPFDAGEMSMGLSLFYAIGPMVAALAVQAGASCKVAFSIETVVRFALLQHLVDHAQAVGFSPFRDGAEPQFIDPSALAETNWPALAKIAGEPVDLDAWDTHHRSIFAEVETRL